MARIGLFAVHCMGDNHHAFLCLPHQYDWFNHLDFHIFPAVVGNWPQKHSELCCKMRTASRATICLAIGILPTLATLGYKKICESPQPAISEH